MESETARHEAQLALIAVEAAKKQQLIAFLTENTAPLLGTLRSYVQRMGLATGNDVPAVAAKLHAYLVIRKDGNPKVCYVTFSYTYHTSR